MSGYNQEVVIDQGAPAGGPDLIEKPFTAVDLLSGIRRVLDSG
jgi:hypothetical protein